MDSALDFESRGCGFESHRGLKLFAGPTTGQAVRSTWARESGRRAARRQRAGVVNGIDSKSIGLCPREFKSHRCRKRHRFARGRHERDWGVAVRAGRGCQGQEEGVHDPGEIR